MGRWHPSYCEHGKVIDWGDFGPNPDDPNEGLEDCEQCDSQLITGSVGGVGGKVVSVIVDDDTAHYPPVGARVCIVVLDDGPPAS